MNMVDALDTARQFFPDREAVICGDTRLTYDQFWHAVGRTANGLRGAGVAKGDRVCLFLTNSAEFIVAHYATMKIGAICVSLSHMIKAHEVAKLAADCGAMVLITEEALASSVPPRADLPSVKTLVALGAVEGADKSWEQLQAGQSPECDTLALEPGDAATMIYTSGTTGQSKGVVLTHGNLVSNTLATKFMCGMRGEDRAICFLPMSHSFAQNFISNSCIQAACTLVITKGFDPVESPKLMEREKITRFYAVPPIYIMFLGNPDAEKAIGSVRYCFSAASSMPEEVARRWKERFGLDVNEGYGLTESTPFSTYNHEYRHKAGSVGTPVMNVEIKIIDPEGNQLAHGEPGEILIRGPNIMRGYWGKPEETAKAVNADGWLHTEDVGYLDEEGYLFLVDRLKDMINNAGLKVWPREVEEVIYCHPKIRECAVIGVPHDVFGETVKACCTLVEADCVTEQDIIDFVRGKLSDYKVPRVVEFFAELPKNSTGKILKRDLRQMAMEAKK